MQWLVDWTSGNICATVALGHFTSTLQHIPLLPDFELEYPPLPAPPIPSISTSLHDYLAAINVNKAIREIGENLHERSASPLYRPSSHASSSTSTTSSSYVRPLQYAKHSNPLPSLSNCYPNMEQVTGEHSLRCQDV